MAGGPHEDTCAAAGLAAGRSRWLLDLLDAGHPGRNGCVTDGVSDRLLMRIPVPPMPQ